MRPQNESPSNRRLTGSAEGTFRTGLDFAGFRALLILGQFRAELCRFLRYLEPRVFFDQIGPRLPQPGGWLCFWRMS